LRYGCKFWPGLAALFCFVFICCLTHTVGGEFICPSVKIALYLVIGKLSDGRVTLVWSSSFMHSRVYALKITGSLRVQRVIMIILKQGVEIFVMSRLIDEIFIISNRCFVTIKFPNKYYCPEQT